MPQNRTAFVIVSKAWFDLAIQPLITGEPSKAQEAHMLIGPADLSDHRGLWLKDFKSRNIHKNDGATVTMDVMVPWQYVITVGVADEADTVPTGFSGVSAVTAGGSTSSD